MGTLLSVMPFPSDSPGTSGNKEIATVDPAVAGPLAEKCAVTREISSHQISDPPRSRELEARIPRQTGGFRLPDPKGTQSQPSKSKSNRNRSKVADGRLQQSERNSAGIFPISQCSTATPAKRGELRLDWVLRKSVQDRRFRGRVECRAGAHSRCPQTIQPDVR